MRTIAFSVALLLTGLGATTVAATRLYLQNPPLRHTGGFGEPNCSACHFDNPVNDERGEIRVSGFPETYQPGRTYTIVVEVRRPEMTRGGFQAAVRHAGGEQTGRQAGTVRSLDERVAVAQADSVRYLHHTVAGSAVSEDIARWHFEWTAPVRAGEVVLHTAANAANGDNSEFGDYIYLAEILSRIRR
jgi:hypothetical protein